jgi:hypothetical protein
MEVHPRARLPRNPRSKMWLDMEWGSGRSESRYKSTSANVNPCGKRETRIWLSIEKAKERLIYSNL